MRSFVPLLSVTIILGGCPLTPPGEGPDSTPADPPRVDQATDAPRLGPDRLTQQRIASGEMELLEIRRRGRAIFSTPFSKLDGYGDGPMDRDDPISPGGRPTLQDNGSFLRVNGLDAQSCLECHSFLSAATIPATFGVGGVGGSVTNAIFQPTHIDMTDEAQQGFAGFTGRFINPPFLFGSGGVELLAKEMTVELQSLRLMAEQSPGSSVRLTTKGVDFGTIRYDDGVMDASGVEGIDDDLIVRPFGRKGEFPTVRAFDVAAMMFHFGMQPIEMVGEDEDADNDGVINEIMVGEISALHIFNTTLERPIQFETDAMSEHGRLLFESIGCAECHIPTLFTQRRTLPYAFPEVPRRPFDNEFFSVDLTDEPTGFDPASGGGITVPLYADLKRHDMGPELAESFGSPLDSEFTTARLWGVADTAPYLHDGRATTLHEAIMMHGGESETARDDFAALSEPDHKAVIAFLRTLRTPLSVGEDLD